MLLDRVPTTYWLLGVMAVNSLRAVLCIRAWLTVHDYLFVVHLCTVALCDILGFLGFKVGCLPALHVGTAYQAAAAKKGQNIYVAAAITLSCVCVQVYGLRPFRIPLRWDFTNISNIKEDLYNGIT